MKVFDEASPWVTEDNRRLRAVSRTTPQSLNHKHAAMLPPGEVEGRAVLDLGCCLGATGYWALRHGAARYVGVEVQEDYARVGQRLFEAEGLSSRCTIHQEDLTRWLQARNPHGSTRTASESHDVVVLAGVLYGFVDPLYVLRMACGLARDCVVVDMLYPARQRHADAAYVEMIPAQRMALATQEDGIASGAGCRISPAGLDAVMTNYGFTAAHMEVERITDTHDAYNELATNGAGGVFPMRYISRFTRGPGHGLSVNEAIASGVATVVPHGAVPR